MAKEAKFAGGIDRISSLPDPIISEILSVLPLEDAVHTSILSSRWRYLFNSISGLDFADISWSPQKDFSSFKDFVDRFFSHPDHQQAILEYFRANDFWFSVLDSVDADAYNRLHGWICAALQRRVKEIRIHLTHDDALVLPPLLFTSDSLVTMDLDMMHEAVVPENVCLPNLKYMYLRYFLFSDAYSLPRLISGCPALEELALRQCLFDGISELYIQSLSLKRLIIDFHDWINSSNAEWDFVVNINAPSLVYFKYVDYVSEGYTLNNMKSLEKADIRLHQPYLSRELCATNLLREICNVKSLYLAIEELELAIPMHPKPVITFHKLVELEIKDPGKEWYGMWVIEFLHCAPNLKKLILDMVDVTFEFGELPKEVPSCVSFHLMEIRISLREGDSYMFAFISYFMNHASVLEKFVIQFSLMSEKCQIRILKGLLNLPMNANGCLVDTYRNVKSLYLAIDAAVTCIQMAREGVLEFQKLLALKFPNGVKEWQGIWVIDFLHCFPNLNALHLKLDSKTKGVDPLPEEVPYCVLFHLKEIKFSLFEGVEHMFEMVNYFWNHATHLEKLVIAMDDSVTKEEKMRFAKKLLELPWKSNKCQIEIVAL